jgi:hypothetical protein
VRREEIPRRNRKAGAYILSRMRKNRAERMLNYDVAGFYWRLYLRVWCVVGMLYMSCGLWKSRYKFRVAVLRRILITPKLKMTPRVTQTWTWTVFAQGPLLSTLCSNDLIQDVRPRTGKVQFHAATKKNICCLRYSMCRLRVPAPLRYKMNYANIMW